MRDTLPYKDVPRGSFYFWAVHRKEVVAWKKPESADVQIISITADGRPEEGEALANPPVCLDWVTVCTQEDLQFLPTNPGQVADLRSPHANA